MSNHPIKVLVVEPAKAPYVKEIDGSLESMQALVGGGIEAAYPYDETVALRGAVSGYLDVFRDRAIEQDRNRPKLIYIHLCAPAGEAKKYRLRQRKGAGGVRRGQRAHLPAPLISAYCRP